MFSKKPQIDIEKTRQEAYQVGIASGYNQAKMDLEALVDKRALDLYTNQNWLVNPNQIFQVTKTNIPYLNQEPITRAKLKDLQQQAKTLLGFELWAILTNMIRQKAIEKAIKESTEYNHVLPGKMMVHNIALMESLVKYIAEVDLSTIAEASGKDSMKVL